MTVTSTPGRRRGLRAAMLSMVIGGLLLCLGAIISPWRTAAAYLTVYVAALAAVLGTLAMVMIAQVTGATWFVAFRRQAEQVLATVPLFAVLFIPVLLAVSWLYPWAHPGIGLPPAVRTALRAKAAYLNFTFFLVRAVVYWTTWIVTGKLLHRTLLMRDRRDSEAVQHRLRMISVFGLLCFAFTVTYASFDWMMSLTPIWYSTIYGVNYFAGAMVGALALLAVLTAVAHRDQTRPETVGPHQIHQLAKLLLVFLLFWAYVVYSQLIVIWSAEIPVEVTWYVSRTRGGWAWLAAILLIGHFTLPFCALLFRTIKRNVIFMGWLGAWLLLMHYLDLYWIVMPNAAALQIGWQWLNAAALAFIGGAAAYVCAVRRPGQPTLLDLDRPR